MARQIVLISGPVCSGKSSLATLLVENHGFTLEKTNEIIRDAMPRIRAARKSLQRAGDKLDRETDGAWIADHLARRVPSLTDHARIVVDSVRVRRQVDAIRRAFGARVVHVHLSAHDSILSERYGQREGTIQELESYVDVKRNRTERTVEGLAEVADVVIDTQRCTREDVLVRAASQLGLYDRGRERLVDVVVGGQYGSEGKGHIVSYLSRDYEVLLRVGGPNAGHKVYEEPKPFTFHHLPSGTRASEAQLVIGPGAVVWVPGLLEEIAACQIDQARLSIHPSALVITAQDKQYEVRKLKGSIGSTASGVGAATARRIRNRGLRKVKCVSDEPALRPFVRDTLEVLSRAYRDGKRVLVEGTQGTGLSLLHGPYPYVTSRDTTVAGCLSEAGISPTRVNRVVMVCRSYPIRVESPSGGTSGPMSIDIDWRAVAERSRLDVEELRRHEKTSTTNRPRRVAEFDWALLRTATALNAPTDIALTFADYIDKRNTRARRFDQLTGETIRFIGEVERVAAAPVSLISTRFNFRSIIDRRRW